MKAFHLTTFLTVVFSTLVFAQSENFINTCGQAADSLALTEISTHPEVFKSPLPGELDENSGIIFFRDKIWTHNDSGGNAEIYALDTATGQILQTIRLLDAQNVDWEDITQDMDFIYVGDFGNNRGNRTDLRIYKIEKAKIPENGDAVVQSYQTIHFSYADQQNISKKLNRNNHDCEAMISFGESLFLFSKNWVDQKTRVYQLPKVQGEYAISPIANFEADGLITGAALSVDNSQLALLGYIDFESFLWLFWDFVGEDFFSGNCLRVNFPDMIFVQTEGICFLPNSDLLISCEESSAAASLFTVNANLLKSIADRRLADFVSDKIILSGIPPEFSRRIKVDVLQVPKPDFAFELLNRRWEVLYEGSGVMHADHNKMRIGIKTKDLADGLYFLKITSGDYSLIRKVRVKH